MIVVSKWRNIFRGTNALQIILCVILFHSLASILIIYIHLMWFFSEEKLWKRPDDDMYLKEGSVVWNIHSALNVLASRVISNDEISTFGWWMDHVKFETDIRCFNQRSALCSKGFSTMCKTDGIRAIYQYITFSKDSAISGFDLSVTATADQLESQAIGATFGVLAVVKLHDGKTENVQIQFPSNIEPLTSRSVSFSTSSSYIFSVTVMLMCYGYSGSVHFTDPVLIPYEVPSDVDSATSYNSDTHEDCLANFTQGGNIISSNDEEIDKFQYPSTSELQGKWRKQSRNRSLPEFMEASFSEVSTNPVSKCPLQLERPQIVNDIIKLEELQKPANKSSKDQNNLVTLVTQVSMERLSALERSLRLWFGPVSLVIYVAAKHSEKSEYEWQRLYIQKKLKTLKLSTSSHVTLALGSSSADDYPINALRNIAVRQVKTKYMFLLDGDFQPSPDFQQKFSNFAKHFDSNPKVAFVVPAFEYIEPPQKSDNAPQTKEELLQLLHREEPFILPFRITESSESHRNTDYWKWYRADKPYSLKAFCDKYEPYIVLQNSKLFPFYDERFSGYGMNKVTHITELFAANYTFVVLPDVWVLHLPHKISAYAVEFLHNAYQRLKNRRERFEFVADVMHTYRIGDCK